MESMESKRAVVLLHGMFGRAEHWRACADALSRDWPVFVPELPVFDTPPPVVDGLVDHLAGWMDERGLASAVLCGNSLGGHLALRFALRDPRRVAGLILSGSSGLFEHGFEQGVPRHPSREWLRAKSREVFYEEKHVTAGLLDELDHMTSNPRLALRILRVAKAAKHENLQALLHRVTCPVLLAWGEDDRITPPAVAEEFRRLLPAADLKWIPRCGHAAMIEHPDALAGLADAFLRRVWPRPSA